MKKIWKLYMIFLVFSVLAGCKSAGTTEDEAISENHTIEVENASYQKLTDMFLMDNYTYEVTQNNPYEEKTETNTSKKRGMELKEEKICKTKNNTYEYFETGLKEGYATQSVEACIPEGFFRFKTYDACIIEEWMMEDVMDFHTGELEFSAKEEAIQQIKNILEYAGIKVSEKVDIATLDDAYYEKMNKAYEEKYGSGTRLQVLEKNPPDAHADYKQWKECYFMRFYIEPEETKDLESTNKRNIIEVIYSADGVEMLNVYD